MNRGEIWTAAGSGHTSTPRPVLVVQDDRFDATDSVIVIPLTTLDVGVTLTRVPIAADAMTGISDASFAMVDKVTTVRRTNLGRRTGRATAAQLVDVERSLLVVLGIAG